MLPDIGRLRAARGRFRGAPPRAHAPHERAADARRSRRPRRACASTSSPRSISRRDGEPLDRCTTRTTSRSPRTAEARRTATSARSRYGKLDVDVAELMPGARGGVRARARARATSRRKDGRAILVHVGDKPSATPLGARGVAARAPRARAHRGRRGGRHDRAAARSHRPEVRARQGQARRGRAARDAARRRGPDLRPQPHARAGRGDRAGTTRSQGHRSHAAHPRHLRAARREPRRQAPGRARAAASTSLPRLGAEGRLALAPHRRHRRARARRDEARDRHAAARRSASRHLEARAQAARASSASSAGSRRARAATCRSSSIVGYTNAGKSTLLNTLTGADVLAEDKLFATLDTRSRRLALPATEREVVITDTVGFIRDLPKDLFAAFRATFEEAADADLLLHVVDASDPLDGRSHRDHRGAARRARARDEAHAARAQQVRSARGGRARARLAWERNAVAISAMDPSTLRPLLLRMEICSSRAERARCSKSQWSNSQDDLELAANVL